MLINEGVLRQIIREEIERVERAKKKLIIQGEDIEVDELSGYDVDRPAIPGGKGSHSPGYDVGRVYEDEDCD